MPSSKGCIRLDNKDIIRLFNEIPVGTLVYIDPDMGTTP
ncbi:MAG TPA: L,D-transpeptidase [Candidatus Hydrogenedentes bacterium]|nr:L,D-transpeptidase [Candidatus Hydrogenedentota bacterium]